MKHSSIVVALLFVFLPNVARADDKPEVDSKHAFAVEPTAGWVSGSWFGIPVARVAAGIDIVHMPKDSVIGATGTLLLAGGSTENGLGAHRAEIGVGLSSRPGILRAGTGLHLSYAMLQRATMDRSFVDSLFGNVGGFGIGLHAVIELALPLTDHLALTLAGRASGDVYDGGLGWEAGPFGGLRF